MTTTTGGGLECLLSAIQPHDRLSSWLKGEGIDKALKAMNISATAKKPGRVLKRVGKELGEIFRAPRLVSWDKASKTVHASATSRTKLSEVALEMAGVMDAEAVFQTDLYFRANQDVTEVNASVVAAMTVEAIERIAELNGDEDEMDRVAARAMALARVLQTGVAAAGFDERAGHDHLIPAGGLVLKAVSLPILRTEFDKEVVGKFVLIVDAQRKEDLPGVDLQDLEVAMTKDGHPGEEAFAELVAGHARARHAGEMAAE